MQNLLAPLRIVAFKRRFVRWDRDRLAAWQLRRARRLVRWCVSRLPYYRELYSACDLSDVWNLPTTNKTGMMANLERANVIGASTSELISFRSEIDSTRSYKRLFRGRYAVELSSGTSGAKGLFVLSPRDRSIYGAMIAARNGVPRRLRPIRAVLILRVDSSAFDEVNRAGLQLRFLHLATSMGEMVRMLNEFRPNVLAGQPWVLRLLATERRAGRLLARPEVLAPIAEVLEPEVRQELIEEFGAEIREIYQASEGLIASSCEHGRLHLNEDFVAVQLYDQSGSPVRPGEIARRMVVTDLYRRVQPIIRYELNDMIELDHQECPCGSSFRVVRRVHGRSDDLFELPATEGGRRPIFPDFIRRAVINATEGISEYQVVQQIDDRLKVRVKLEQGRDFASAAQAIERGLTRTCAEHGCETKGIEVVQEFPEIHPDSRKLRRIIRHRRAEDAGQGNDGDRTQQPRST